MGKLLILFVGLMLVSSFSLARNQDCPLAAGPYHLKAKLKFQTNAEVIEKTDLVLLSYRDDKIWLEDDEQKDFPIIGSSQGNEFKAHLNDARGTVDFAGIIEGNTVEGQILGKNDQGVHDLTGEFVLYPANRL